MVERDLTKIERSIERDFRRIDRAVKRDLGKLLQQEIGKEKRVALPSKTKKAVYKRANGRCERCGMPLKMTDKGAHFHHRRPPTVKSKPPTIQFLCATCHMNHGHDYKSRTTGYDPFGRPIKKRSIVRKKVRKYPSSPYWKLRSKPAPTKTEKRTASKKTKSRTKKTRRRRKTPLERLTKQIEKDFF